MTCLECGEVLEVLETFDADEYITYYYKCPICGTEYEIGTYDKNLIPNNIEFNFQDLIWGCDYNRSDFYDIEDDEEESVVGTYTWYNDNKEIDVSIFSPSEKEKLKHDYWK